MTETATATQAHTQLCLANVRDQAEQNWSDHHGVDLYSLPLYGEDGDTATGPFAQARAEAQAWADSYLVDMPDLCTCEVSV